MTRCRRRTSTRRGNSAGSRTGWACRDCSAEMTAIRAVTIDFHDTIAIAPAWFALEVRQLPALVLDALADAGAIEAPGHRLSRARMEHMGPRMERAAAIYRALREEIQEHGREQD